MRGFVLWLAVLAGCYRPDAADCSYRCGADDACPDNLTCELGYCRAPGATTACGGSATDDVMPGSPRYSFVYPDGVSEPMALGYRVAVSADGNRIVAGAINAERGGHQLAGTAYVFDRTGSTWTVAAELRPDAPSPTQLFGSDVAITPDGLVAVVGALGEGPDGAVYIYDLVAATPTRSKITAAADVASSVAISDDGLGLITGGPSDSVSMAGSGVVVFANRAARTSTSWTTHIQRVTGVVAGRFGSAVAINADASLSLIGEQGFSPHRVRSFVTAAGSLNWLESTPLDAGGTVDDFGESVSLGTNAAAVGAPTNAGGVYVFEHAGTNWNRDPSFRAAESEADDGFGGAVHMLRDDSAVVVGAPNEDSGAPLIDGDESDNSMDGAGAVYVFLPNGRPWIQTMYIKAPTPAAMDGFGCDVAASANGKTIVIGALRDDEVVTNGGGVYVIDLP